MEFFRGKITLAEERAIGTAGSPREAPLIVAPDWSCAEQACGLADSRRGHRRLKRGNRALARILRDPPYLIALAALVAVIGLSVTFGRGSSSAASVIAQPTEAAPTATPAPTVVPTATLAQGLLDARRGFDLARDTTALETYRSKFGAYPSSDGLFTKFCTLGYEPACRLISVTEQISASDGERPYWYRSDGQTYTMFAEVWQPIVNNHCPRELPPLLTNVPVLCAGSPEGTP